MANDVKSTGWLVVLGSTLALIVGNGSILFFTFGIFLKPITEQMGWHRGTASLGVAIGLTLGGLATPLVGRYIDKWGVQRVTLIAITVFALSVASLSLASSVVAFVVLYSISGLLSSGQAPLPYAKAITAWFDARRGLALGVAMAGVGIGAALMPQVADVLLRSLGWREAYVALGVLVWLVAFPSVLLFVKDPVRSDAGDKAALLTLGDEARVAIRKLDFWVIALAILLVVTAVNGTIAHLVALLTDRGMPQGLATRMMIAVGLSTILGRLISGYLLDRVFAPYLAAIMFLIPLLGLLGLWMGPTTPVVALAAAICLGFGLGAEVDVIGYLVGRYFGLRRYGQIYGYMFAVFTIGAGAGPYLMGLSFDLTHSYLTALGAFSAMLVVASAAILLLGPYRYPAQAQANPATKVVQDAA